MIFPTTDPLDLIFLTNRRPTFSHSFFFTWTAAPPPCPLLSPPQKMIYLPIVGRLSLADYCRIIFTWSILLVDGVVRFVLFLVPTSISATLDWWRFRFVGGGRFLPRIFRGYNDEFQHPVADLQHTADICRFW